MGSALACCLVAAAPALAGPNVHTEGLKLTQASGVPDAPLHKYILQGQVSFESTGSAFTTDYEKFWLDGKAEWDQTKTEATEFFILSGSMTGKLKTVFRCHKDPWLYSGAGCVFISAGYMGQSGNNYDWPAILKHRGLPFSSGAVTLAQATALSKQSASAKAPPPPPPAPQSKTKPMPVTGGFASVTGIKPSNPVKQSGAAQVPGKPYLVPGVDLTGNTWVKINSGSKQAKWNTAVSLDRDHAVAKNQQGCRFKFEYVVRNLGPNSSGAFSVSWLDNNKAILSHPLGSLQSAATATPADLITLAPGSHLLTLVIDNLNQVAESNEANNRFSLTANVDASCGNGPAHAPLPPRSAPVGSGSNTAPPTGTQSPASPVTPGISTNPLPLSIHSGRTMLHESRTLR